MIGRVYKITSEKAGLVYIGSTIQTLGDRFSKHKCDLKRHLEGRHRYKDSSFQVLECDDAKMELIEELEVADKKELFKREGYYQRTMECVNKFIADRSRKEWFDEHKEHLKEHQKKYHAEHKEHLNAISRKYRDEHKEHLNAKHNCDCGGRYATTHRSGHLKTKKHQDYINQSN
jgi:hypothetical protein